MLNGGAGLLWVAATTMTLALGAGQLPKPVQVPLRPPAETALPEGPMGEAIRLGQKLFVNTPQYAAKYSGNALSCGSCHLEGGRAAYAAPMGGLWAAFPTYLPRAGRVGTLEDRINGCFLRSMNGRPLPAGSEEMRGLLAYIWWLSREVPVGAEVQGRGLPALPPPAKVDPTRGRAVYARACEACHGPEGAGSADIPPLWGPRSFNIGAGMARTSKAAAFVKGNMSGLAGAAPLTV